MCLIMNWKRSLKNIRGVIKNNGLFTWFFQNKLTYFDLFYHFTMGKIGPKFSHLLTVRAVKRPFFLLTTSLTTQLASSKLRKFIPCLSSIYWLLLSQPVSQLTAINQSQVSQTDLVHYWYLLSNPLPFTSNCNFFLIPHFHFSFLSLSLSPFLRIFMIQASPPISPSRIYY